MTGKDKIALRETKEISDKVLREVIDLARLDPLEAGMALQKAHLRSILDQFKVLRQVDLEGSDPAILAKSKPIPLREDKVNNWLTNEEALANARLRTGDKFRAPKIIGGEDPDRA